MTTTHFLQFFDEEVKLCSADLRTSGSNGPGKSEEEYSLEEGDGLSLIELRELTFILEHCHLTIHQVHQ